MDGPSIGENDDDDEEWNEPRGDKRKGGKVTARKKTAGPPPSKKGRGRPSKNSSKPKVVVAPPKSSHRDPTFKSPADKSRESTCQICRRMYPTAYLAEHMNVAHNAVQGQVLSNF